jgi:eukaryotic-like serine/threonine-protein kinase
LAFFHYLRTLTFWGSKDTMQFWNELEGQRIDGRYPLIRLVRSEGRSAWFESETGDANSTPATISLTEALTDADDVVARLQAAQNLNHPNLVIILKIGQVILDNTLYVYAVMEHIEQSLSDVLQGQALSAEEGREVAEAMVGALTAIHEKGMSHGHVEAASVIATEEAVKLRSDCLLNSAVFQADDVAGIGATLFQAFTQRKGLSATDAQINRIPAPFAEIVRNSFARRWNLAQVANALKPAPPVTPAVPPTPPAPVSAAPTPAAPTPAAPTPAAPTPAAPVRAAAPAPAPVEAPASPQPEPVAAKVPEKTTRPVYRPTVPVIEKPRAFEIEEEEPVVAKRVPVARYVALAVVVLAIIAWLVLRSVSTPSAGSGTSSQTQAPPPTTQAAPPASPSTPPASPAAKKPSAAVTPRVAAPVNQPTGAATGRSVWRVIAYAYKRQEDATEMVARISGKHPNLKVEVFSPPGRSDVYLVTLGGADMDREQAGKMLDKARSMGLPNDTYIQNFSE